MGVLDKTTAYIQKNIDWIITGKIGNGIKIDLEDPTYPWHDLIGSIEPDADHPGTTPELTELRTGGAVMAYKFGVNREAHIIFHMPHDYAAGTDMYIHGHWSHNGTGITGNMDINYNVMYGSRTLTATNPATPLDAEVLIPQSFTTNITDYPQYCHAVNEVQLSAPAGAGGLLNSDALEVDGLIILNMQVVTIPTITSGKDLEPFMLTVDIHYQSTGIGTKNSAPDYYGDV